MISKDEFKMRIMNYCDHLADIYFPDDTAIGKFAGTTAKYIVHRKMYALDGILDLFTDHDGMIDEDDIMEYMCNDVIGADGVRIDVRSLVKNDLVASMLPNRIILLTRKDVHDLFGR